MTQHNWFYSQLFTNWKRFEVIYVTILCPIQALYPYPYFEVIYVTILILLQLTVFAIVPDSPIGMISGVAGVICLVYGMKGRKISFIFGFIQYVAWISHAYGSFAMDIVYVISQPIGWYLWGRQQATHSFQPGTRKKVFFGAFLAWAVGWWVLAGVGGQLPYFDSINFVISFIAQVLYVLKYNENWSLWIFVNIANFIYWSILSVQMMMGDNTIGTLGANLSQVALQAALLFNAVYAQKVWNSGEADNEGGAA